ncbi:CapA family protein [Microbulbifer sp. SSSA002]|uniref:CapA family protein n=1 Tax=Microbulbifer sp. SSSA002 TaxID=3243376 RepID=UPI00403A4F68
MNGIGRKGHQLIKVFSLLLAGIIFSTGLSAKTAAHNTVITGRVVDEQGKAITGVEINNNDGVVFTRKGNFRLTLAAENIYQLKFSAAGYYPLTHTFSAHELTLSDGKIPDVTLVARKPGRVMLAFAGDLMTGRRYYKPLKGDKPLLREGSDAAQFKQLLAPIKPYLVDADIASVNLEAVLAGDKPGTETPKSVTFYSRPLTLAALKWAGIDYVTLGNNHLYDFGDAGVTSTLDALRESGLKFSGGGLNEPQALESALLQGGSQQYSLLGFVGWRGNFSPNQVAEGEKAGAALGSEVNIARTVAREAAEQRPVVVQYHGSEEYSYAPTELSQRRMKLAIDRGADLVIGHHPHVLHGFELYRGKLIAYSLGNFLFDQYFQETHRSALLYVWMDGEQFVRAEVAPLYIQHYQPTPAVGAVRQHILRRLQHQSFLNGLSLSASGGHGVILPDSGKRARKALSAGTAPLAPTPGLWAGKLPLTWQQQLPALEGIDPQASCTSGRDLLVTGDFESDRLLPGQPSTWRLSPASSIDAGTARSGDHSMVLRGDSGGLAGAVTRGFHRLVEAAPQASHSLLGYARSTQPQSLQVCLEYAPRKRAFSQSLASAERECFGTVAIGGDDWQAFRVDFPPLDKQAVKGYRLRLQAAVAEGEAITLDDLAWVAWDKTAPCAQLGDGVTNIDALALEPQGEAAVDLQPEVPRH